MTEEPTLLAQLQQTLVYQEAGFQWPPLPFQRVAYRPRTEHEMPCVVLAQIGPKWYVVPSNVPVDEKFPIECTLGDLAPVKSAERGWVPYRFWATFMAERRPASEMYDLKQGAVPNQPGNIWRDVEVEAGRSRRNPFRFAINGVVPVGAPNGDFCLRPIR